MFKHLIPCMMIISYNTCYADCVVCPENTRVIFVNNSNSAIGNGTLVNPYHDLLFALSQSNPCDVIYVFPGSGPYDGFFQLQDNQRLLGTTAEAFELCPEDALCMTPTLQNSADGGAVVRIFNNNQVSGFNIICNDEAGIGGGVFMMGDMPIANALITDNHFFISNNANGILFNENPSLGTVNISNCSFVATDASDTNGVLLIQSGGTDIEIANNIFSASNNTSGLHQGFLVLNPVLHTSYSIHDNQFFSQVNSSVAIGFSTGDAFGSQSIAIINNFVDYSSNSATNVGIGSLNLVNAGTCCVTLLHNTVLTPVPVPGYVMWNGASNPFLLNFDNSNKGTLTINGPDPSLSVPPPSPFTPVILTTDCN